MTEAVPHINRKADFAIAGFKWLIATACLALLFIVLARYATGGLTIAGSVWFWLCVAVEILAYLAAGVMFMIWFYAAYKRVYLESPEALHYPPLWTVLGFSVPVANLFLPYVLTAKLWRRLSRQPHAPGYFKQWWSSHLLVFFAIPAASVASLAALERAQWEAVQFVLALLALLLMCNSARLAIRLVRELKGLLSARFMPAP